jgi:hypothetical protein
MLPQVTFRGLSPSAEVVDTVYRKAKKLSDIAPLLRSCHVVIEASQRGGQRPVSYRVSMLLSGGTDAQSRAPRHTTHENLHIALGEVFRAARRHLDARTRHPRGPSALLQAPNPSESLRADRHSRA